MLFGKCWLCASGLNLFLAFGLTSDLLSSVQSRLFNNFLLISPTTVLANSYIMPPDVN